MSNHFIESITPWWEHRSNELHDFKTAEAEGATIKLTKDGETQEVELSLERSKQLLKILVELIDAFLEESFPELDGGEPEIESAFEVYDWHRHGCERVEDVASNMENPLSEVAKGMLLELLELPFTMSRK